MALTPKQKQALSGLVAGIASAVGVSVEQVLANPPFTLKTLLSAAGVGAALGFAHWLPALGTAAQVQAKAKVMATDAVGREIEIEASKGTGQ